LLICGSEYLWPNLRFCSGIYLEGLNKTNHKMPHSGYSLSWLRFSTGTLWTQGRRIINLATFFSILVWCVIKILIVILASVLIVTLVYLLHLLTCLRKCLFSFCTSYVYGFHWIWWKSSLEDYFISTYIFLSCWKWWLVRIYIYIYI
jgi:hypothetical protein